MPTFSLETLVSVFSLDAPRVVSLLHGSWILLWSDIDPNGLICWRMARRVTEKGIQAERWHIHLGFINGLRGDELFRYARNAARQTDSDSLHLFPKNLMPVGLASIATSRLLNQCWASSPRQHSKCN